MTPNDHAELASIKRFDQLVRYLRDRMGWPIDGEDFDDLTFDYTADELGIDPKNAAKIREIKRLRPLKPNQPWGIFFVNFEPKRLPVVALRRILSQVALKKRASANKAERQAWAPDDLLFVSNYGEGGERQIAFAHFSAPAEGHDLPTLKVLGWNNQDTGLHLEAVASELTTHLAWPKDESDVDAWRQQWRSAFTLRHREVITTARELSERLAVLARSIHDRIKAALDIETENGPLTKLMEAFKESLVHDLDENGFADMYAQTIAYGLLSARIADPHRKTADDFATHMRTNPFLRELMETFLKVGGRRGKAGGPGIDFDELGVGEVVELLDHANMEAVVSDFGDKNPQEDPVIHFYEHFLAAYDKKQKVSRGVFYTPRPVVSYIVRSVDEVLRTEFGLNDGLADTATWGEMVKRNKNLKIPEGVSPDQDFVQILDPACGTGTFLVEIIDLIYKTLVIKWKKEGHGKQKIEALWNEYVPRNLLTRLYGYELLMAPYAIAHLKLGLKLYETGYRFESDERARIFLTNALEPASDIQFRISALPALAHEAQAVNYVKRNQRFTVIVGNPPYSNFGKLNKIPFILELLDLYKRDLNEKKLNLDDDFIKFLRLAHFHLDLSGNGVLGFITNNTYFDGITHRQMRLAIRTSMARIVIVDLHGSAAKKEVSPDGSPDQNVFDIQQGTGISFWIKRDKDLELGDVDHGDVWGVRQRKYNYLAANSVCRAEQLHRLHPTEPYQFFVPKDFAQSNEYKHFVSLTDIFAINGPGVKTERDSVTIHWTLSEAKKTVSQFRDLEEQQLRSNFHLAADSRDWKVASAKLDVKINTSLKYFRQILYRPFDYRYTWYSGKTRGFIGTPSYPVMKNMLPERSLGLLAMRQFEYDVPEPCYFFVTPTLTECRVFVSNRGIANCFPLYVEEENEQTSLLHDGSDRRLNFRDEFLAQLTNALMGGDKSKGRLINEVSGDMVLFYIYAIFHSPSYRNRYAEFHKIEFPRLPLPGSIEFFSILSRMGGELVALHLLESAKLDVPISEMIGNQNMWIEKIFWSNDAVWIDKAQTTGFKGIHKDVWNFHIGGYQVCEKWLKDRKGRKLSKDDIIHYQKIIVALSETIRLMKEIDKAIDQHGGWPGAFAKIETKEEPVQSDLLHAAEKSASYTSKAGETKRKKH